MDTADYYFLKLIIINLKKRLYILILFMFYEIIRIKK